MRISLRDLFWLILLCAVGLGFYVRDNQRQAKAQAEIEDARRERDAMKKALTDLLDKMWRHDAEPQLLKEEAKQLRERLGE